MLCRLCNNQYDCFIQEQTELQAQVNGVEVVILRCSSFEPLHPQLTDHLSEDDLREMVLAGYDQELFHE